MKAKQRITRSERRLFLGTALIIAFILAFGAWRQWVNVNPQVEVPESKMPSPNAFDVYVAAGKLLAQHQLIDYAAENTMPIVPVGGGIPEQTRPCTSADRLSILSGNSPALTLLRQGKLMQYREPANRSRSAQFPYYSHFRWLTKLLVIQGREYEYRLDWNRAAHEYLSATDLGRAISDNSFILIGWATGQACEGIGQTGLWRVIKHLNSAELRVVLNQLQKREDSRSSLERIFREESLYSQTCLLEIFQQRDWATQLAYSYDSDLALTDWKKFTLLQAVGKRGFFNQYVHVMELGTTDSQLPYKRRDPPHNPESITNMYEPDFERFYLIDARTRANSIMLATTISIQLYRKQNSRYPRTLKELVPNYLKHVPIDPFGNGELIRYKLDEKRPILYSIGPDGVDNNGLIIKNVDIPNAKLGHFMMTRDSRGDFVAGINH